MSALTAEQQMTLGSGANSAGVIEYPCSSLNYKHGSLIGRDQVTGLAQLWDGTADTDFLGYAVESKASASTVKVATGRIHIIGINKSAGGVNVTGTTSAANNGARIYCSTDNISDATLTETAGAAIGSVKQWKSGALCEVILFTEGYAPPPTGGSIEIHGSGGITTNTAYGTSALAANTTGATSTAVGYQALLAQTVGVRNVAIGSTAATALTTGTDNVAIGAGALDAATTAVENIAIGTDALGANTVGTNNIAIGDDAMLACTTANACVAIGRDALLAVTTGVNNIAIGDTAGNTITTGSGNTILGQAAQASAATAVDQIVLGRGVTGVADNAITLGDVTRAITCNFDADQTWDAPSDLRHKNVRGPSTLGLGFINLLQPIEYTFKPASEWPPEWGIDPNGKVNTDKVILGLGAQDVKAAMDAVGETVFHGWGVEPNGRQQVGESAFIYPLINAVKELHARVTNLEAKP